MKLQFLGCGSGYTPLLNNTNAFFVKDNTFFLLDCGFTTFNQLVKIDEFLNAKNFVILLTHLHADHCGSLSMTISYSYNILHRIPTLIFPLHTVNELLTLMGIPEDQYILKQQLENIEGISGFPIVVQHTPLMNCFGYFLKDKGKSIFYSGDSSSIPEEIIASLQANSIDEIYQDITYEKGVHPSHGTLDYLDSVISPECKHKVYCMHFAYDFREEVIRRGYQVVSCYTAIAEMS
ncbi:MAG: MBL fold metallo-hydrolase [Spirochaetia bacterium]|nr:MBL fold metallo-hydrolase [Spirochaetia bacterium]